MAIDATERLLYAAAGAFVATLPFMLVAGWALLRGYDWSACLAMSALIVLAGWLRWAAVVVARGGARRAVVALGVLGVTRPARTPRRTDRPRIDAVAALGAFGSRACVLRAPVGAAGDLAAGLEVTERAAVLLGWRGRGEGTQLVGER